LFQIFLNNIEFVNLCLLFQLFPIFPLYHSILSQLVSVTLCRGPRL
jgi:hypothetical protein